MHVFDRDDRRANATEAADQLRHALEERQRFAARGLETFGRHLGQQSPDLPAMGRCHLAQHRVVDHARGPERGAPERERKNLLALVRVRDDDAMSVAARGADERTEHARFSDSRLAQYHECAPAAGRHVGEEPVRQRHFVVAANQRER